MWSPRSLRFGACAALSLLATLPARAAELGTELGASGGYSATTSTADGSAVDAAPYLSAWVGGTAVFEASPRLAPFLALSYDAYVPLADDGVEGHGPLATAGLVWLPSETLAVDASVWGLARFFGGEAPVTVGLAGGSVGGELAVHRAVGLELAAWHIRRFSEDPVLRGATTGGGPGVVWRPGDSVRLKASWGLEYGPAFLTDYGEGVLPVPAGATPGDVWSQVVRARLRLDVGGGFFLQPAYRLRLGEAADGAPYHLHTLQVAFGWRS